LEGDLHDAHPDGLVGHDPRHVLDQLLLLPHLHSVRGRQQVQLVPPALERGGGDVHVLADVGGRPASVLLLDGPDPGLHRVVFVCHYGGVVGYFGVVVNTPRKLHSAGPTNRDYPKSTEGHSYFIIREAAVVAASEALQERAQKYKK